jgi:aspartate carbamoyltransferase catalytic subunit
MTHLLGLAGVHPLYLTQWLDRGEHYTRWQPDDPLPLRGRTQINLFFEPSTRTQTSFELAGKRLGMHVVNMGLAQSSLKKGETLLDTAVTLAAMRPDVLVVRHPASGAVALLAEHVNKRIRCAVVNAGDGTNEHPTQGLLDALTIRRNKGAIEGLSVAICGDILHSRVARSNLYALTALGARVRVVAPSTLMPSGIGNLGVEVFTDFEKGIEGVDVIMMLRLQRERMNGAFLPSSQEYFARYGLTQERLRLAKPDAIVLHPGPMNRGIEIASEVADGAQSRIEEQVTMGVAMRMAVLEGLVLQHSG